MSQPNIIVLSKSNSDSLNLERDLKLYYYEIKELEDLFEAKTLLQGNQTDLANMKTNFNASYQKKISGLMKGKYKDLEEDINLLICEVMRLLNDSGILKEIMNQAELFWDSSNISENEHVIQIYQLLKGYVNIFEYIEDTISV